MALAIPVAKTSIAGEVLEMDTQHCDDLAIYDENGIAHDPELVKFASAMGHEAGHILAHMALYDGIERFEIGYTPTEENIAYARVQFVLDEGCPTFGAQADVKGVCWVAGPLAEIFFDPGDLPENFVKAWQSEGAAGDRAEYEEASPSFKMGLANHAYIAWALLYEFTPVLCQIVLASKEPNCSDLLMELYMRYFEPFCEFKEKHFGHLYHDYEQVHQSDPLVTTQ